MQFFVKLSKRIAVREVAPTLAAMLALAGILGHGAPILRDILKLAGSYWG